MTASLGCVIVSVDQSEESMYALKWALDNLKLRSSSSSEAPSPSSLIILHVQSPPSVSVGISPGSIPFGGPTDINVPSIAAAIQAHQNQITEAVLKHALQICSEKKVSVKTEVVVGDPKDKICEVVDSLHPDLLVMGCRSIGAVKRFFLGSVSNYCTNHARCPVLVIKGKDASYSS